MNGWTIGLIKGGLVTREAVIYGYFGLWWEAQ
jgi:hypothetical protein